MQNFYDLMQPITIKIHLRIVIQRFNIMKKTSILLISLLILMASACKKQKDNPNSNNIIQFQTLATGGCNNGLVLTPFLKVDQLDTVIFKLAHNDTLVVSVGFNYDCCASFTHEAIVVGNEIDIKITDVTAGELCRCMCYYTSSYTFTDFKTGDYKFRIFIKKYHQTSYELFREIDFNYSDVFPR
jgi:hypothetical protein